MRWWVVPGVVLLLIVPGGWLAYKRFFETYTITRRMQPGEQWIYTVTHTIQLGSQQATLSYQLVDTVQQVQPDGHALVERVLQADPNTLTLLQRSSGPLGAVVTRSRWRCAPDGSETPVEPANAELFLAVASQDVYPRQPVRRGQEWARTSNTGSLKTRITSRFEGTEQLSEAECFRIVSRIESLPGSLPEAGGTIMTHIDRQRGWVRQIEARLQFRAGSLQPRVEFKAQGRPTAVQSAPK
jgi:hypothetical protein